MLLKNLAHEVPNTMIDDFANTDEPSHLYQQCLAFSHFQHNTV